jgi:hypothetical protein
MTWRPSAPLRRCIRGRPTTFPPARDLYRQIVAMAEGTSTMIRPARVFTVGFVVLLGVMLTPPPVAASPSSARTGEGHRIVAPVRLAGITSFPACSQTDIDPQAWPLITLTDVDGLAEKFWVGTQNGHSVPGALWHEWQNTDRTYSAPVSLGGWLTSDIAGASNNDGRLEIFGRAGGGDLAHIWELAPNGSTGWSAWASLGGALAANIGPGTRNFFGDTGSYLIFVRVFGPDGFYHCKAQQLANGAWSDWY